MQSIAATQTVLAAAAARPALSSRSSCKAALAPRPARAARRAAVVVQAKGPQLDRTTGYIDNDNSGKGNIFAIEPKTLYTSSPTSDAAAKQGIGGIVGIIVVAAILGVVVFSEKKLETFEETNQEFANYQGSSLTYYSDKFSN